jgi:hypothetical protein
MALILMIPSPGFSGLVDTPPDELPSKCNALIGIRKNVEADISVMDTLKA